MHAAQALSGEYLGISRCEAACVIGLGSGALGASSSMGPNGRTWQTRDPIMMALTHEEIANMAGTSRETVTRLLNQFRRDQWIVIKGSSLIVKPDQLESLTA